MSSSAGVSILIINCAFEPSIIEDISVSIETIGVVSLSLIVPTPISSAISAFTGLLNTTLKLSSSSYTLSSFIGT